MPKLTINYAGNPNSTLIRVNKQKFRALIDSGADTCLMHTKVYKSIPGLPKLSKKHACLQTVNGDPIEVDGSVNIKFQIGNEKLEQVFHILPEMNHNIILGRDWLLKYGVREYWDLQCIKVGKSYIPLVEDIHINSVARLASQVILKPQSVTHVMAKTKINDKTSLRKSLCQVYATDKTGISNEPGLILTNAVVEVSRNQRFPIEVINNTNKMFKLNRGCVIGKIEPIEECNLTSVHQCKTYPPPDFETLKDKIIVDKEHRPEIEELIQQNISLFAEKDLHLTSTDTVTMTIDTGNHAPVKQRPYCTPLTKRAIVDKAIDEMLEAKIIRPSNSPWASPIVIVDKKDGTKRFCVDFRQLNKRTVLSSYPLPLIDELLCLLGKAKYFTCIDLKSGYWQVEVAEKDKEKTAFTSHRGLFEYNVMPFGLTNAPGVFQRLMSTVLRDMNHFSLAYLDYVIIFSSTFEEHQNHIFMVFDRLREHNLKMKISKCKFAQKQTQYLGLLLMAME